MELYFEKEYQNAGDVFEFYVETPGRVIFRVKHCYGSFMVHSATSFDKIENDLFDLETQYSFPGYEYIIARFPSPGSYYLKVDLNTEESKEVIELFFF